jgi:demethylmenaquinone methyltransferase/2-methoxy-6-polyprenyl-1,4-benzoquinol methylase
MTENRTSSSQSPPWDREALRAPHTRADKALRVEAMFDAIASTYERVNTVASLGRDAVWRRRTVAAADVRPSDVVLDLCCGTGDMLRAFAAARPPARLIIGVDFAAQMLARGVHDGLGNEIRLIRGDALRLPLADESVDVISCVFGVRNFQDLQAGLCEMYRVARPGGRVVILEFALPENRLLRWGYRFYCEHVLPRLATLISGDRSGAYRYLPRSIQTFERRDALAQRLEQAGFGNVRLEGMNFGGVVLYRGEKPGGARSQGGG